VLAILVSVAALLMLVAGGSKIVRPEPATDAFGVIGLAIPPIAVRVGAAIEALVALAALGMPGPVPSLIVGASYLLFAGFVLLLRREPDAGSCGCFGNRDERPSRRHMIVNLLIAVGCLLAVATRSSSAGALLGDDLPSGLLFLAMSLTAAWLVGLVLSSSRQPVSP
jgi:hypothetical protein